mmetsp:Transcript_79584/g.165287  ORF Transcript_79584/g.165287 Transcript_79584/m.165287 type:complete len:267 (+) Transcript_79584:254-1054(+)
METASPASETFTLGRLRWNLRTGTLCSAHNNPKLISLNWEANSFRLGCQWVAPRLPGAAPKVHDNEGTLRESKIPGFRFFGGAGCSSAAAWSRALEMLDFRSLVSSSSSPSLSFLSFLPFLASSSSSSSSSEESSSLPSPGFGSPLAPVFSLPDFPVTGCDGGDGDDDGAGDAEEAPAVFEAGAAVAAAWGGPGRAAALCPAALAAGPGLPVVPSFPSVFSGEAFALAFALLLALGEGEPALDGGEPVLAAAAAAAASSCFAAPPP